MIGIRSKTALLLRLAAAVALVIAVMLAASWWVIVSFVIGIGLEVSAWITEILHVEKERSD